MYNSEMFNKILMWCDLVDLPQSSRLLSDDDDSDDNGKPQVRPQRRVPALNSSSQDNSSLVVKGIWKCLFIKIWGAHSDQFFLLTENSIFFCFLSCWCVFILDI